MLKIVLSNRFKKDLKIAEKRGLDLSELEKVVVLLAKSVPLPEHYRDHALVGDYADFRECHIKPDWLLIYSKDDEELELFLFRTGSHSDYSNKKETYVSIFNTY